MSETLTPEFTRTLRLARPMLRGEDVLWLQSRLQAGGWPSAVAAAVRTADGLFGVRTAAAVEAFQRGCGLVVDGMAGPEVWARLRLGPNLPGDAAARQRTVAAERRSLAAATDPAARLAPEALAALARPHARFSGGALWSLTAAGVATERGPIPAGPGHDAVVARVLREWFPAPIQAAARRFGVPVELIAACLCTESAGGAASAAACAAAERQEPGFRSYAATPHRVSIGCMQTLISTASGALGRPVGPAELRRPEVSIEAGTACIAEAAGRTLLDPPVVACAYNAGSVRHDPSAANRWRMLQYPVGSSAHADRFVAYFNAALRLLRQEPGLAGGAPSFAAVLAARPPLLSPWHALAGAVLEVQRLPREDPRVDRMGGHRRFGKPCRISLSLPG